MGRERRTKVLLAGYADDLAMVVPLLAARPEDTTLVNQDGFESELPEAADVVVFVFSRGATYSTQLRIVCNRVYYRVSAQRRYLLPVGDVDLAERAFPEFAHLPRTGIAELNALLERSASSGRDYSNL
jgi:hypothetical protein